jgi:threonyl-tRNA synthetase
MKDLSPLRHSLAHLLAAAVLKMYPDAKRTIGPAIDNGFYFDFEFSTPISEKDLPKIEKQMRKILPTWDKFERSELNAEEAKKEYPGNPYKHELIEEFTADGSKVSFYKSGDYWDLCKGGHVDSMKTIDPDSFKLTKVAGAYWRGSEKNAMLTRIYGVAFETKAELDDYLKMLEEAEKRDHKKLGPKLGLFMFHETSPGMPYWLPKGVIIYNELVNFWRQEHTDRNYQEIVSPLINKKELYQTSGHYDHYWNDMFTIKTHEGEEYGVKAMNCPNAMIVFGSQLRSYRDLPLRLSDTDTLHRNEISGALNGLLRVREFRQDDAHCFVTEEQIGEEYQRIFEIVERFYSIFGLEYSFRLGTRPESFMGEVATWDKAESTLQEILKSSGKEFTIAEKDGAFYGPKVDILMKDALGRDWQMGTIQLDFQQPQRFKLEYIDAHGEKKTPVAIHRVIYGSLERFIGIIIEEFAGAFPVWLSPVQVKVLPISDKTLGYAEGVLKELKAAGIRAELDSRTESIGKKIREAEMEKVPYMLIVGEKEVEAKAVAVRARNQQDMGAMDLQKFLGIVQDQIKSRSIK